MAKLDYQRLDDLVNILLLNRQQPLALKSLVSQLAVSDRTIRHDIAMLNDTLPTYHAKINLIRSKGYQLVITDNQSFMNWWYDNDLDSSTQLTTPEERQQYLLYLLLTSSTPQSVDSLLDNLYISKNTFYTYLKQVKEQLTTFNLKLINHPNVGFELVGLEFNIRKAIIELLIRDDLQNYIIDFSSIEYHLFEDINLDQLQNLEMTYLKDLDLLESDFYHKNVLSALALSITRIMQNKPLKTIPIKVPQLNTDVTDKLSAFIKVLEKEYAIHFNIFERDYCYYNIGINFPRLVQDTENTNYISATSSEIVNTLLNGIKQSTNYNWTQDEILRRDLTAHIKGFVNMDLYNTNRTNPLLETIKKSFPLPYDLSLTQLKKVTQKYGIDFSEDEVGYIALHLAGAIERNDHHYHQKTNVAIVCASGRTLSKLIEIKLKKKYAQIVNIVGTYSYAELMHQEIADNDILISTIPISETRYTSFFLDVNNLDRDIERVGEHIAQLTNQNTTIDLFKPSFFYSIKESISKEALLTKMASNLSSAGFVESNFIDSVLAREKIGNTCINNVLAIPHPMSLVANQSALSLAIAPGGIPWGDNIHVNFICLFSITREDYAASESIYDLLLDFLEDTTAQKALLKKPTLSSFKKILKKY
ncbi:transcriptional antiterminator [Latilactobacillus curvatus]|uniref:Transcriptional antiterminator n=1 Tax=Latilactobacillus curvatus TaxID=28038 RepID=A0AAC9Y103_LATCU|nr:PTS sugar transporter subunit IIA [Latilactobacillus curvatus]ASN60914.1 transcriptional antiterminator [Latilactobacillus curvatus]